jgi:peptidoglycan LD-endopeptidase LytH
MNTMNPQPVIQVLSRYAQGFHPVVPFDPARDKVLALDFTATNTGLTREVLEDTGLFSDYIHNLLSAAGARYGLGGYLEYREVYSRSRHFDGTGEPRRLHLGVDIWGPAGVPVFAFMGGRVHSIGYNDRYGDYGATLILQHQIDSIRFHTLYGHICLRDIEKLQPGPYVVRGQEIAHFGKPEENGHWPPHLHFQIILDMEMKEGDYPGVCALSEKEKYSLNCPDPDLILRMKRYLDKEPATLVTG